MADILYLVHRLPYPPNKGDKVRSYHLLLHLARRHRVALGTFVDDPEDFAHVDALRPLCADLLAVPLDPLRAKARSLLGLLEGAALTRRYYRDPALAGWVEARCRRRRPDAVVVFSSAMGQYVLDAPDGSGLAGCPVYADFVDVDSAKWRRYADDHRWPLSWLYRREGERLLAEERRLAARAAASFFVTEQEAELFRGLAPESAGKVAAIANGVDAGYFAPAADRPSPYGAGEQAVVFTGAMDYWPNIDAVCWFAQDVLPRLLADRPGLRFVIAGRSPAAPVRALAGPRVTVTGTVADVRPYLQHAAVVVAPLRIARGIQNKILEALAMGRPVVASSACAAPLREALGDCLPEAGDADAFAAQVGRLLADPALADSLGAAGRRAVQAGFGWDAQLGRLDPYLSSLPAG